LSPRARIAIEVEEVVVLRRSGAVPRGFCAGCLEDVDLVTPAQAGLVGSLPILAVSRLVESGALHAVRLPGAALGVCLPSLLSLRRP
jgi:hypothetical protein